MNFECNKNLKIGNTTVAYDSRPDSVELWFQQLGITLSPPQERRIPIEFETLKWQDEDERVKIGIFDKLLNKIKHG